MSRYILKNFGCKANLYDSQRMEADLQARNWIPCEGLEKSEKKEAVLLCIINTCTVTNEADKQGRKMAAKLARENPEAKIVVTGCGAEVNPKLWADSPGVSYVVGNQNKHDLVRLIFDLNSHILNPSHSNNPPEKILGTVKTYDSILSKHPLDREWPAANGSFFTPPTQLKGHSDKTRSFLKIQEGCNSFCTYCIIPYGRGPSRSIQLQEIINQLNQLVTQGVREVILTGTNIGDYGQDWNSKPELETLLKKIFQETDLERLRISSLDPSEVTPEILLLMEQEPRFCPHLHISLQSPHSRILKLMKRKYNFETIQHCLEQIKQIKTSIGNAFVGMDIITGFPGETEKEFQWGLEALSKLSWTRLHVFPYSERSDTPATRLPHSVPQSVRVKRTQALNAFSLNRQTQYFQSILTQSSLEKKTIDDVLIEKKGESSSWMSGYSPHYLKVLIPPTSIIERNQLVSVQPLELMIDSKNNDVAFVAKIKTIE